MYSPHKLRRFEKLPEMEHLLALSQNEGKCSKLLLAITVMNLSRLEEKFKGVEADLITLQEKSLTQGESNENIDTQLKELRTCKSHWEASPKSCKDYLDRLRSEVTDQYTNLNADTARNSQEMKTLEKQLDHHEGLVTKLEKKIDDFLTMLPRGQDVAAEMIKAVSNLLMTMKPQPGDVQTGLMAVVDQKAELENAISDLEQNRTSLENFESNRDAFSEFLENLHSPSSSVTVQDKDSSSMARYRAPTPTAGTEQEDRRGITHRYQQP
ncbi:hypothetical protein M426DRAFT_262265 [Hypoxylon sp. CI-4A]|nr:hypothetical protein M426DRAFT_262265 [Hypoxylon sp. CI-4A]